MLPLLLPLLLAASATQSSCNDFSALGGACARPGDPQDDASGDDIDAVDDAKVLLLQTGLYSKGVTGSHANTSQAQYLVQGTFPVPLDKTRAFEVVSNSNRSALFLFIPTFTVAMVILVWMWRCTLSSNHSTQEAAALVQIAQLFIQHLTFTLIIPSSYHTALAVGLDAVYSGILIGMYQMGVMLASVVLWFALLRVPDLWRRGRILTLAATGCNVVGAVSYCMLVYALEAREEAKDRLPATSLDRIAMCLLASRIMDGFGTGIVAQLSAVSIVHLFPSGDRPSWMASTQFAGMLGIGLGPLMHSIGCMLDTSNLASAHMGACGIVYVGIALASSSVAAVHFPVLPDSLEDHDPAPDEATKNQATTRGAEGEEPAGAGGTLLQRADGREMQSELSSHAKVVLLCGGLVMNVVRGFVISGLEAATALLLEERYSWNSRRIGIGIGACFLVCIPVKALHGGLKNSLTLIQWIRAMSIMAIVGSFMLFTPASRFLGIKDGGLAIMLGDAVLFPTLFLGDALNSGLMMMAPHLFPQGSRLDANHFMLYRIISVAALGRNLGPPLARFQVAAGGQDSYAAQQLALAVIYLILFEAVVVPRAKVDNQK